MDYEKAYKEALELARSYYDENTNQFLDTIFPELRESEDERIRKWLVDYFGSIKETVWIHRDITCEQILEWLEKQKEPENTSASTRIPSCWEVEQKEQKPAEWSEKDKKILDDVSHILIGLNYKQIAKGYKQAVEKLIYARPSWKPSEEHLSALLAVFNDPDNIGSQTCQLALTDLYEQLKKL